MDSERYYARTWRVLRGLVNGLFCKIYAYEYQPVQSAARSYLVVANHNTDLDPVLVGLAFPRQMRFVASEHVFRKGIASWLLRKVFNPISRIKGSTDASAALGMIRSLRKGENVCMFAEGNRSFSGVTGPIASTVGKLIKSSGAALITFKLEGGYLTTPRWSKTLRRGRMRGYCVHEYSSEQLADMTAEAVNAAVAADLFEDAFMRQETDPCEYRGKRLAEGLEDALFLCPKCGSIATLHGEGDTFACSACGMQVKYNTRGFFEGVDGADAPFTTVRDWDAWQMDALRKIVQQADADTPLFSNDNMQLNLIGDEHTQQVAATGTLTMSRNQLALGEVAFPLNEISDMALVGPSGVVFTAGKVHYEIASAAPRYCGRRYLLLYQLCKA